MPASISKNQEHLLQWMTVGDLLGDLVGRMETHYGGRCCKRNICIATEGHRRFATREGLTILRELALALPVLVNKCWLNSGFPSLTRSWQLQRWPDWTYALFPDDSGWGVTLVAGFVQVRPFNLWCRMRVGPRIPSCCPSNGKCEPMKKDLLKTEF